MFDYRSSSTFNYFSDLNPERRKLINQLQAVIEQGESLEAVLGVEGDALAEAIEADKNVFKAPLMSALDRYSPGVMYKAMDFAGLPTGAQRRLLENAIIFSGLFGLLRPDDLIPNYRLPVDATLPEIGKVSRYWRPYISPLLNETLKGYTVWNLLPDIHREAWEDEHAYDLMIDVLFFNEENGNRKPVSNDVMPLRGQLVNYIVREMIEGVDDLKEWEHPAGFRYDEAASRFDDDAKTATLVMVRSA